MSRNRQQVAGWPAPACVTAGRAWQGLGGQGRGSARTSKGVLLATACLETDFRPPFRAKYPEINGFIRVFRRTAQPERWAERRVCLLAESLVLTRCDRRGRGATGSLLLPFDSHWAIRRRQRL